jgi:hypothetical protein
MGQDTDEIIVAANGQVMVAQFGAVLPTTPTAAYPGTWADLGFTSEDGVTITDSKTLERISVWQLFYPGRLMITERDFQVSFVLRQWNRQTFKFAFGGGAVLAITGADPGYSFGPPQPGDLDDRSLGIDWQDGVKRYRLILPRGIVTENVETQLVRTGPADLPITFGIIGQDGVDPWKGYTNDPAFAA